MFMPSFSVVDLWAKLVSPFPSFSFCRHLAVCGNHTQHFAVDLHWSSPGIRFRLHINGRSGLLQPRLILQSIWRDWAPTGERPGHAVQPDEGSLRVWRSSLWLNHDVPYASLSHHRRKTISSSLSLDTYHRMHLWHPCLLCLYSGCRPLPSLSHTNKFNRRVQKESETICKARLHIHELWGAGWRCCCGSLWPSGCVPVLPKCHPLHSHPSTGTGV